MKHIIVGHIHFVIVLGTCRTKNIIIHNVYTKHGFPFDTINAKHRTKKKCLFM